jgi:hypothetical protein
MRLVGLLAVGALGAGLVWLAKNAPKSPPPAAAVSLDSGIDATTASAVQAALVNEKDPNALTTFATKLQAAGFNNSAAALRAKALTLRPLV